MKKRCVIWVSMLVLLLVSAVNAQTKPYKILVVSSYHHEYLWSQDTQKGVCAGLLEFGFLDNASQAAEFTETDIIKSSTAQVKKVWMDTKHKSSKSEIAVSINRIMRDISMFDPDLVMLGDDNAANYIGNQIVDVDIPVVFWGINGLPLKYGLLDTLKKPGHNITGVYQAGYFKECLAFLQQVVPTVRTFAVLSDDSPTGRSKVKALENLHNSGDLPLKLLESVITNSFSEWKIRAKVLETQVDAFFIVNHNSIKNDDGNVLDQMEIGAWYLRNINKPECAHEKQFAQEGILCVCDDSGYNQGYEAMKLVYRILQKGEHPGDMAVKAPPRGPFIINRQRAEMLGIQIMDKMGAELYVDKALALTEHIVLAKD